MSWPNDGCEAGGLASRFDLMAPGWSQSEEWDQDEGWRCWMNDLHREGKQDQWMEDLGAFAKEFGVSARLRCKFTDPRDVGGG